MVVTALPTYQGYTVDERLREFRKAEAGETLEFIAFDSPKGRRMLWMYNRRHVYSGRLKKLTF